MTKRMLIDALHPEEMRVIILNEKHIEDFDFITSAKQQIKGNIYLAKITRVEPSLQAAFVEYGGGKQGFLPFAEIHPDYYQIPVSDRKRLIEEAEAEAAAAEAEEEAEAGEGESSAGGSESAESPSDPAAHEDGADEPVTIAEPLPLPLFDQAEAMAAESTAADYTPAESPANTFDVTDYAPHGIQDEAPRNMAEHSFNISASTAYEGAADAITQEAGANEGDSGSVEDVKPSEEVETLSGNDEVAPRRSSKKPHFSRRYKIQEVIKRGQIVLVQVIKEERGNKGVSLTTYLSLAGRYCVLMPNSPKDGGISRKIANNDDRKRLKQISAELKLARGMSAIIRTAGMDRTRAEIKRDYDYLVKLWNRIREDTLASTAPALVYEESDLVKRSIRDLYSSDIEEIIVQGDDAYRSAKDFMKMILPSHTSRIKHHTENTPLLYAHNVEEQLLSMYDPVVKLRSGGYIVINPTEALVSIDVNSGRATGERNIEETAHKTNIEAAQEIARQLRLRDLAGLIVIDFIDMMESRNRRGVEKAIKEALKTDRAKIQLGRISPFGLLEMSRQRLRPSLSESSTMPCPHCAGRGTVRSDESFSIQIIRTLEKEASTGNWHTLRLSVTEGIALHMLNTKRAALTAIEEQYGVGIQVIISHQIGASTFHIEKMRRSPAEQEERARREPRDDKPHDRRSRGRGRHRSPESERNVATADSVEMDELPEGYENDEQGFNSAREGDARPTREGREERDGDDRGRRRRRGGRNRNRNRDRAERNEQSEYPQAETSFAEEGSHSQTGENNFPASSQEPALTDGEIESRPPREGRRERGRRGGRNRDRGRKRWQENPDNSPQGSPAPEPSSASEPRESNVENISSWRDQSVPAFAAAPLERPVEKLDSLPQRQAAAAPAAPAQQDTPPANSGPPRKGWWQRMIELDE